MAILSKLFTLFRGTATEAGQAVVDANALRILDQETRDAQDGLNRSRDDLAKLMAQRKLKSDGVDANKRKLVEYEGYMQVALQKNDEALQLEVAQRIADLEEKLGEDGRVIGEYDASIEKLRAAVAQGERGLERLRAQIDTVRATESVQRAQATIAARHSGTNAKMRTALDSLERIKQRQAETGARIDAAEQLQSEQGDDGLKRRLFGESMGAEAVLARYRKPQASLPAPESAPLALPAAVDRVQD
ncbi:MAG: PspA/IM30 family protein [Xanthomonadaceae bacterium]|nr:PspA/IM30 family protein [Xanthomonadaceae bacterium]